jgi:hypothetical protein
MRLYLIIFFPVFLSFQLFTQTSSKGIVSLVFNDERMNLPINIISINKDNGILLSVKAE